MTTKPIHLKKCHLLIITWLLTMIVTCPLISFVVIKTWENHKNTLAKQIDALSDGFSHDISTALMPLNTLYPSPQVCDKATIKAMKQADYRAKNLTNFAIVREQQIICTTESGKLTEPVYLPEPDWVTSAGVKVILEQPIPLFEGKVTERTVQAGSFLAFLDYQRNKAQTDFAWLKYKTIGLADGKIAYSHGNGEFATSSINQFVSGKQWYENGHWLFSECSENSECKIIAIDILSYFQEQKTSTLFLLIFLIAMVSLTTIAGWRLHNWFYSLPRQVYRGLNFHQLELHYQPIIGLASSRLAGCEVLCRWHTIEGIMIRPDEFISVVENNQQTRQLTELVITKCINELRAAGLLGKCRIAINAFPDDIASGHILRVFQRLLPLSDYSLFTIELTEQKISNLPALCEGVRQLRTLGFRVAIDDFGTGFSNLEGLRELRVDILKIDKSFVWGVETPSLKQSLVEHIVNIAKSLQLKIVAEGVETREQLAYLHGLDVEYSQGYLHSRPLCLRDFAALLLSAESAETCSKKQATVAIEPIS